MGPPERDDSCTFTWNPSDLTLEDLATFMSLVHDLYNEVAFRYVTEELYGPGSNVASPKSPRVTHVSMGSPLVTQLLAGSGGIVSLGMVGFILKNPDRLGEFLPRISESWYKSKEKALVAKLDYVETRARVNTRGRPIGRFERELSRTRGRTRDDRTGRSYPRPDDRPGRSR